MSLGTVIKGFNAAYFKRWVELIFDVLTQIVLLMCLFGFMDLLIFVKWTTDWYAEEAKANAEIAKKIGPQTEANKGKFYSHGELAPGII